MVRRNFTENCNCGVFALFWVSGGIHVANPSFLLLLPSVISAVSGNTLCAQTLLSPSGPMSGAFRVKNILVKCVSSIFKLNTYWISYYKNLNCGRLVHGVFKYVGYIISPFCTLTCCHYSQDRACKLKSALITHHGLWADIANRKQFSGKEAL